MGDLNLKLQAHCFDFSLFGKFYNHALGLVYTHLVTFPCVNCVIHELHVVLVSVHYNIEA